MKKLLLFGLFATILFSSCKKNESIEDKDIFVSNQTENLQIRFAKILAPALADNSELRSLIKSEALKMFDKDYDILYQLIKDKRVGEKTVSEFLSSYANSKEEFDAIEENLPLLTIFIPTLPNFTPINWNTSTEIPKVAVCLLTSGDIPYYDKYRNQSIIHYGLIPGFPIIVIKQNERVLVGQTKHQKSSNLSGSKYNFSFLDESFDGSKLDNTPTKGGYTTDPVNIEAYNLGMEWHRDYVYYGLTPTKVNGAYRNNYSEFITSFCMLSDSWLGKISDDSQDPFLKPSIANLKTPFWTDGFFEFKITVLINSTNGMDKTLTKYFSAKGSDLATVTYVKMGFMYRVDKVIRKRYNPNLELIPWDLKNYGMAWKFIVSEYDPKIELSETKEVTTQYALNFNLDLKIGLKFGAGGTRTEKTTFTYKTTKESDDLGEAILTFDQPIITGITTGLGGKYYITREISTGWCSLNIEPKRIY
ncbi:MAG: hypothetical protein EHM93_01940 [Bacteroidales bacterium]|nr:MAG: hypothetical protein EHM93_01940 [Bacteroidales bacterium]